MLVLLGILNQNSTLSTTFMRHEQEKNLLYDQRITEVEHGSFTPLAYSTSGGMGPSITIALQVSSGSAGREEGAEVQPGDDVAEMQASIQPPVISDHSI